MATTLTKDNEILYASFPIEKTETTADGDLIVYGKASDGSVDFDQQIVDPQFARKAVEDWFNSGANLRVQHNAQRDPAGIGISWDHDGDATWVKALVVEPVAKRLVSKGALRAYSVGIARPTIERDVTGKARGGIIKGGQWVEISLVDRPANGSCGIQLVKSASDGTAEYVGKVFGSEDAISKALGVTDTIHKSGDVSDFNPGDFEVSFSPNDMAELVMKKMAQRYVEKRDFDRGVGGGVDRDKLPDSDFAGPHRSFPIVSQSDVGDALHLVGHAADRDAVRARIRSIADRKGFSVPESASSPSKKVNDELAIAKGAIGGSGPLSADCEPDDPTPGENVPPRPEKKDEDSIKEASPDVTKEPENPEGKRVRDMDADGDYDAPAGKAAMPPKKKGKKAKGKKLPPWLNKPADGDDGKNVAAEEEKCHTTPKEAGSVEEAADMQPAPVGDLLEYPAKPHMKADGLTEQAMMRFKTIGMDTDLGILHDMTCPAFHPAEVAKVFPYADFSSMVDEELWQRKALAAATGKSIAEATEAQKAWSAAVTLKYADAAEVNDFRADLHKAFRDANPGVSSFPTPCAMSPQKYHRPQITDGHAAYGSGYSGPTSSPQVASGAPNAHSFSRPPLGSGHQSPSPSHMKASFEYPDQQGVPTQIRYAEIEKDKARRALSMLHDHLNHMFPSACPMLDQDAYRQEQPDAPVALPVGLGKEVAAEPKEVFGDVSKYIAKLTRKVERGEITESQARDKLAKRTAQKYAEDLRRQVDKGMTSIEEVRRALGLEPEATAQFAVGGIVKTVDTVTNSPVIPEPAVEKGMTPDVMKSMMSEIIAEQIAPFQEKITAQESLIAEYQKSLELQQSEIKKHESRWEALANERDPSSAAFTGLAFNPVVRNAPAGIAQQAEVSKSVQGMMMRQLERTWRTSENPAEREAAYNALQRYQGKTE